jgi:hypothetical protein
MGENMKTKINKKKSNPSNNVISIKDYLRQKKEKEKQRVIDELLKEAKNLKW